MVSGYITNSYKLVIRKLLFSAQSSRPSKYTCQMSEWVTGSNGPTYYFYNSIFWTSILWCPLDTTLESHWRKACFYLFLNEKMPLTISDFMLSNVYLGFKECKLPGSLHGVGGGKRVVKFLSEAIEKKDTGSILVFK